jgi:probable phosphomutase (TIGR03848 family)
LDLKESNLAEKPTRVLLVRHGMNDYVKTHRIAGWTPGVHLNDHGKLQAEAVAERLASEPVAAVYSSPLERTMETAEAIAARHQLPVVTVDGVGETHCGEWTGQLIEELAKTDMWKLIQGAPSRARFPGGESIAEIQNRMAAALDALVANHPEQTIVVVSHSDPIKLTVAFYIGQPLDLFQRLVIQPASVTELEFGPAVTRLIRSNDCAHLPPEPKMEEAEDGDESAAVVEPITTEVK